MTVADLPMIVLGGALGWLTYASRGRAIALGVFLLALGAGLILVAVT